MRLHIELSESDLQRLVNDEIQRKLGSIDFDFAKVRIEVKSKQNYKAEWEIAAYRAVLDISVEGE